MRYILSLLIALTTTLAQAQTVNKAEIEAIVRETILSKPEIIEEAIQLLQVKAIEQKNVKLKEVLSENSTILSGDKGFHAVVGNPKGDVTLVEFSDYNCGFCRKALQDLQALMKEDAKLRVVIKELPIIRRESESVAKISIQLRKDPKFLDFHQKLFSQPGLITEDTALKIAKDIGFDSEKLKSNANSSVVKSELEQSFMLANALDVQGTPTYIIGDTILYGAVGLDKLKSTIANIRKCGKGESCSK